jgi:tripeptidyl-peptidase-1
VLVLFAVAITAARIRKEDDVRGPPAGWIKTNRADLTQRIALILTLKPANPEALEATLFRVSDPKSSDYGKHLTFEEAHALAAPPAEARAAVRKFLRDFNADIELSAHPYDGMIRTVVTIATAEKMLACEYYEFVHSRTNRTVIRTSEYSLPEEVASYIGVVGPTVSFPANPHFASVKPGNPDADVTPTDLRNLYNVGNAMGTFPKNFQVANAFLNQFMSMNDLNKFWSLYYPPAVGETIQIMGNTGTNPGTEANLDIQYITAMGGGVPSAFWYFPGTAPDNPQNEPFLNMLYYIGNLTIIPYVVSTSYGEDESSVSLDYATSCNTQFQYNGARGITFVYSSGDSGVGSDNGACTAFAPQWPADSPYVTSVGATQGMPTEVGVTFSSGGFSNRWPRQPWQSSAVSTYLSTAPNLPDSSRYNASGRAFPDVAAQGVDYAVVINGNTFGISGTSCSAPCFSGIVSLLNDLRFNAGKSSLGFLNPFIYQNPSAFNDVLTGNNPGCGTPGFYATVGWDPVTGYGTPNYATLSQVVMALP